MFNTLFNAERSIVYGMVAMLTVSPYCLGQQSNSTGEENAVQSSSVNASDQDVESRLSERALNVLYTKTNLSLAELELQRALELNSGTLQIVPRLTIERLKSNMSIARELYEQAKLDAGDGLEKVRLRHAKEKLRLAKVDMQAADTLKEKNGISEWEYARVEIKLELAKLNLALLQHPTGYLTLVDGMQRQIDRLGVEILALDQRISKLEGSELTK